MNKASLFLLIAIVIDFALPSSAAAQEEPPKREQTVWEDYTEYTWLMVSFSTNRTLCELYTDHAGTPTANEIYYGCEQRFYERWENTPACEPKPNSGAIDHCRGVYLYLAGTQPRSREVTVRLPEPYIELELYGCTYEQEAYLCSDLPYLLFRGHEPVEGERIESIEGTYLGQGFDCPGAECLLPLQPTTLEGTEVEFWALSSFGDRSPEYTARLRLVYGQRGPAWQAEVLSPQWRGEFQSACAQSWEVFPPAYPPAGWMDTPEDPASLATEEPYAYLAGRLIDWALVDASACPGGGLLENGYADSCGLQIARHEANRWQNQFDARILQVAEERKIPAQLLKNLFAQETQFWPGYHEEYSEYGLGQFTDLGADFLLFWNPGFYSRLCPTVLRSDVCSLGYPHLEEEHQEMLRAQVLKEVNMECEDCTIGYMVTRAEDSVGTFADALVASCGQTGQTVYNATFQQPMEVAGFKDLWYFTLANYNAGANCLYDAIRDTRRWREPVDWEHVSQRLPEGCESALDYVSRLTRER